jgi:hypothetical protein
MDACLTFMSGDTKHRSGERDKKRRATTSDCMLAKDSKLSSRVVENHAKIIRVLLCSDRREICF